MRYFLHLLLLSLACYFGGCKPNDEPDDIILGEPVFYASGKVNGSPVYLAAGNGDYALEADKVWRNGLLNFTALLGKSNCGNCGEALEIAFRNHTADSGTYLIDSALVVANYDYFDPTLPVKTYYDATFVGQSTGNGTATHLWTFTDNFTSTQPTFTRRYSQPITSDVTYSNQFSSGCSSAIIQSFSIPAPPLFNNKFVEFNFSYLNDNNILVNSLPVQPNEQVQWSVDGNIMPQKGNIVQLRIDSMQPSKVCMFYPIAGDTPITHCKNIAPRGLGDCLSNCKIKVHTIEDAFQLGTVEVRWRDASGKWYSSNGLKQGVLSNFKLVEKQVYEPNNKGDKTMKVKITFNCTVGDNVSAIYLENMEAVIAVAYD